MTNSNRLRQRVLAAALSTLLAATALTSCTKVDDSLGQNIVPDNQHMHAGYFTLPRYSKDTGYDIKKFVETRLFQTDSVKASNIAYGYMGSQLNDTVGLRTAGFMTQVLSAYKVEKDFFGHKPIFDSATLRIAMDIYDKDTLTPQKYNIYEVVSNKYLTDKTEKDSTFYLDGKFDPRKDGTVSSEPLFTFTFPDGKTTGPSTKSVTLKTTPAGREYISRLMLQSGKYKDNYSIYKTDSLKQWVEEFKGLYICPAEEQKEKGKGCIYGTKLESSSLWIYGRNRRPDDESLIKDTIGVALSFYDIYTKDYGNVSVNTIHRDYSQSSMIDASTIGENVKDRPLSPRIIVEGLGGVVSELSFTQEFFSEIEHEIETTNNELNTAFTTMSFSQCRMLVYFTDSDYSWEAINPGTAVNLVKEMNGALGRLGMYTDYGKVEAISDYEFQYEQQYNTELAYDGHINRSRGCYIMDITEHVQQLWNQYLEEKRTAAEENRPVDLTKLENRVVYLGPEAYNYYTGGFSVVQGMATDPGQATQNNAPIRFEFAYNLIK